MQPMTGRYDSIAQDRIVWGQPAAAAVAADADARGARRVFVVASRTLNRTTDVVVGIGEALGPRLVGVFDECREHTPRESVIAAAEAVRAAQSAIVEALREKSGEAATAIERLIGGLRLPVCLRDLGVARASFDEIAAAAVDNIWVRTNPRPISGKADILEILERAY